MGIEKEIKQSEWKSSAQKAFVNTVFTGNWLTEQLLAEIKPYDINDQHYNVLRILKGRHPECASPGEIKEVLMNKRGDLTRLLDKLVKLEMVERHANSENRRMVNVFITKKGVNTLDEIDANTKSGSIGKKLSKKEAELLSELLDKLRE